MKNMKEFLYIFCGLSIIFILIYFAEHSKRKPVDFDVIAKRAMAESRPILEIALEETDLTRSELIELLDPTTLADGGKK